MPALLQSVGKCPRANVLVLLLCPGLGEVLLPAALACAERVDVSRAVWELILS